ncbi:hypothetical protein KKF34_17160 [Myxococcota bacterium]|nr:hypothetical protein [Myxococcota bacterium]MBU1380102.1 hypothetical protein [Myxococcota bacterium]MBU1498610.1 hypothetical protein [Myxococcota bacterium]
MNKLFVLFLSTLIFSGCFTEESEKVMYSAEETCTLQCTRFVSCPEHEKTQDEIDECVSDCLATMTAYQLDYVTRLYNCYSKETCDDIYGSICLVDSWSVCSEDVDDIIILYCEKAIVCDQGEELNADNMDSCLYSPMSIARAGMLSCYQSGFIDGYENCLHNEECDENLIQTCNEFLLQ